MPLAGMLSAMRELLLDRVEAPQELTARCAAFASRFPSLTAEEIEDLARMPSEKLAIYTQTVFAGERSTLRNHFPLSFALIRRELGEQAVGLALVQSLHAARPWKSYLTRGLTHNFVQYLTHDRPDLLSRIPYLADVAQLEVKHLDAARAVDPQEGELLLGVSLTSLNVEELMLKRWQLAPSVQLAEFGYDVIRYRKDFFEADRCLPAEEPVQIPVLAVAARNRRCAVRWHPVQPGEFAFLQERLASAERFTSEDLAAAFIEDQEGDERELFSRFFTELSTLLENGVLVAI